MYKSDSEEDIEAEQALEEEQIVEQETPAEQEVQVVDRVFYPPDFELYESCTCPNKGNKCNWDILGCKDVLRSLLGCGFAS